MIIQNNTQIHFMARNPEIRLADDIARKVNKEYPRISATLVSRFKNAESFSMAMSKLLIKTFQLRKEMNFRLIGIGKNFPEDAAKILTILIKRTKCGNCAEATDIAYIAAKANNLENVTTYSIQNHDHAFVLVNNKKNPYVIDAWLGFADYLPNAIQRWQSEFGQYIQFTPSQNGKMTIEKEPYSVSEMYFSTLSGQKLKNLYPELVL